MSDPTPAVAPAGWYADAVPGTERYWDGLAWTAQTRVIAPATTATAVIDPPAEEVPAKPKRKMPLWAWIVIGVVVLIILISSIANAGNKGDTDPNSEPAAVVSQPADEQPAVETPVKTPVETPAAPAKVAVPDTVGSSFGDARAALVGAGLKVAVTAASQDNYAVIAQDVPAGTEVDPGAQVILTTQAPMTIAQQNAIDKAQSYLDYSGFSRAGLIGQLEYEGYSTADATFGADHAGADWNAEAAEKAQSYLDYSSFSRNGLADQLRFEEFTEQQIAFALKAVGY